MITFIHTSDVHFGMENYGKIDAKTGIHTRLLDFHNAFNFCIDFAIEKDVDFFLFAGDAYKTTNPSPTQQRLLLNCLMRLHKANIPIVIVIGNHDNPLSFGKANTLDIFGDLPLDGFHVIAKPESLLIKTKSGPVQIVGIPWPTRNTIALSEKFAYKSATQLTDYLAKTASTIIKHYADNLDPTLPAVLTGHLTVSSGVFSGSEKRAIYGNDPVFMPSQLGIPPFDYVALGHLHRYQNLNPSGYPPIIYSGSIERIDFGERKEDKGFCYVTMHDKQTTDHQFIKTPQRPFIQIEVTLKSGHAQTAEVVAEIRKYDIKDAIVKIVYHVPDEYQDHVNLNTVQQECAQALDLVGVIPVHKPKSREKRTLTKTNMGLTSLVGAYLDTKPELQSRKEKLLKCVQQLENEVKEQELS